MAKEQSAEVKLKYAAATVHTYESFGRHRGGRTSPSREECRFR